ncbi:DUF4365 domain-containing protein [Kribbella sp. NPDC023972]|uniref:DUF4365 domain-containing protein n=1 Tax=Kribbella sp. NPDC023972 TaxID=3154795 RepID=UPI0033EBC618
MARATESEQTGSVGVSEVTGKFGRIGFGYAEITRHDNGTDVFLMARDARRFDLGLTLGAQIKAGPSWFREPAKNADGEVNGWWFRDDDGEHIDDWLRHGLPHLVVIHDLDSDTSYWVHVTEDAVISTGKGKKVLVPIDQKVDEQSRDSLIAIAASTRPAPAWEGSAWHGADSVLERDLLRYALLVPRLIAPHPNSHVDDPLTASQAIALVLQARIGELHQFEERGLVPSTDAAAASIEWGWRFYAALHRRVTAGELDLLLAVPVDAPDAAAQTAATIAAATSLMEEGRTDEGIALLEAIRDTDAAKPVDHAWLAVQLARAYAEVGRTTEARQLAASVQSIAGTHAEDVTATAVAGVGAQLLFRLLDWGEGDLGATIEASDTAANWWRQQTRGWALADALERSFVDWSRDTSHRWSASDTAHDQLVAAALNATLAGDHGSWRDLSSLLGRDTLTRLARSSDPADLGAGLSLLRMAGDHKALDIAVRRLVDDGPAASVADTIRSIDLNASTHTTAYANLTLLRRGGAVLDEATADATIEWLLGTYSDPAGFEQRVRPTFLLHIALVEALAQVLRSASQAAQQRVATFMLQLPPISDELLARGWATCAIALDRAVWGADTAATAVAVAERHHESLRHALLGAAAPYIEAARAALVDDIAAGSSSALSAFGDVRVLAGDAAAAMIQRLVDQLRTRRESAASGIVGVGIYDEARSLVVLNCWHPTQAQWDPLLDYLADDNIVPSQKRGALLALANGVGQVPEGLSDRLTEITARILATDADERDVEFGLGPGAAGPAAYLMATLGADSMIDESVVQLLAGSRDQRRWAAMVAACHMRAAGGAQELAVGMLIALAHDEDPQIRATTAAGLTWIVIAGSADAAVMATIEAAVNDSGLLVPLAVARQVAEVTDTNPSIAALRARLRDHPFKPVRDAAV